METGEGQPSLDAAGHAVSATKREGEAITSLGHARDACFESEEDDHVDLKSQLRFIPLPSSHSRKPILFGARAGGRTYRYSPNQCWSQTGKHDPPAFCPYRLIRYSPY